MSKERQIAKKALGMIRRGAKTSSVVKAVMDECMPEISLTARCILGHVQKLSQAQIEEARRDGVAFCSQCGQVMFVHKAESK